MEEYAELFQKSRLSAHIIYETKLNVFMTLSVFFIDILEAQKADYLKLIK